MRTLIHLVAGARPNFMKIAPIVRALQARADRFAWRIVHTGQHHDHDMSAVFFEELGIPAPDVHMGAGGGSHARQTARIMIAYEDVLLRERPHCTLVVGDVDSTLACALTARKLQIPVAHVEASLQRAGIALPPGVIDTTPLSFMDFLSLWKDAALVLTDSGGLQEETTALGVPCITLRENTERPITVTQGSNLLAGTRPPAILAAARRALSGELPTDRRPPLWDGQAARRIVDHLARLLPA